MPKTTRSHVPVIVTRAQPGARETLTRLTEAGIMAIEAPVLSIEPDPTQPLPNPEILSGLVFTSANGVRAYLNHEDDRQLTAWCVGPATAKAAREAGFMDVRESAGDAVDLARFIAAKSQPTDKPLLHVANAAAKGDLKAQLEAVGFGVTFCPLYAMAVSPSLPEAAIKLLQAQMPAIVIAHSTKGAEAFLKLAKDLPHIHLTGLAISVRAAGPLMQAGLRDIHIASQPNEDGLMRSLNVALATLSA
ncbi:uroporphyrinogen-III synthase [Hyphomonas sp. FCG-A18]|jgi:uroporphyrinogen-III synthase|uniref:uroporphyrinogen-III synthase n=1 Tax=Hyphomonas sp. FCG-A18 TaxID=3080019 RepID=UPI002B31459E|nr:uroporphyrinogen-III synthase [Hyphomonas sp. FCG-A18]